VLGLIYTWQKTQLVTLHNFDDQPHEVRIRIPNAQSNLLADLIANEQSRARASGEHRIAVGELGYKWYRVGGFGYALTHTAPANGMSEARGARAARKHR
jgi:maltose alpha-D-glucosyltransferase/alpha-amylase